MKKLISILFILILLTGNQAFAQLSIDKGTKFVNLGVGVGGYGYYSGSGIALAGSFDAGVTKNITAGGLIGFRSFGDGVKSFDIGVRGSYHFNELLKLQTDKADLYAGIGVSYWNISYGDLGSSSYGTVYVPFHLGGRYFFSNKIGGFAELGTRLATLKIGVTFKL